MSIATIAKPESAPKPPAPSAPAADKPQADRAMTTPTDNPRAAQGRLKAIGGSQSDRWNGVVAYQVMQALWLKNADNEERRRQYGATVDALLGINRTMNSRA